MKKSNKVLSAYVLRTFVFIAMSLHLLGCGGNSMDEIEQLRVDEGLLPISTSRNIRLILSDSGEVKIVMTAPLIERFAEKEEDPYNLLNQGMEVVFLDSLGNLEANVTSEHAIHYPEKNILVLTKNVVVNNMDGDKLNSEYLIWNSKTKKITSNDFVKITTGDGIMYGDGFEADQDFTNYRIKNSKGIISVEDEGL
ncbi:MAG: LPS export ABC transporter protein LptC [Salibacteraceae bacterium]|jgi:LPS export ABC transporter protein LptC